MAITYNFPDKQWVTELISSLSIDTLRMFRDDLINKGLITEEKCKIEEESME